MTSNITKLKKIIESRFYHSMCVVSYEDVTENYITKKEPLILFKDIPCFFSRNKQNDFTSFDTVNSAEYTGKIYFSENIQMPTGSFVVLDILGEQRSFVLSGEEIVYQTHKEIFVKRKEYVKWAMYSL